MADTIQTENCSKCGNATDAGRLIPSLADQWLIAFLSDAEISSQPKSLFSSFRKTIMGSSAKAVKALACGSCGNIDISLKR